MTDDKIALRALLEKGSDATFLREMIGFAAERLMQLETETLCGAAAGERSTDRINQHNGYRDRDWETRGRTVEFRIPKLRRGSYFPTFLEPRRMPSSARCARPSCRAPRRWRRLVRDYEARPDVSKAMIHVAMGSLLLRRIAHA